MDWSLSKLSDPREFRDPVRVSDSDSSKRLDQLRMMWLIRKAEEKIAEKIQSGQVKCPCHLAIGQEAVSVGIQASLSHSDRIFGGHRSHGHFLATGASLESLFAEVLGKSTGCSRGMGGSMHLFSQQNGFYGSVPIVAGTIPLAVGAALAAKKSKSGDIAVAYFGDGAAEEGVLHESLNFAAIFRLPVLFVCENNLFSSHLHIDLRQPARQVSRFAQAHKIASEVVDGNNIAEVEQAASGMIRNLRHGEGAGFLEVVTYRWRGHVGPSEDIDVGVLRNSELMHWKKRDPIDRLARGLMEIGSLNDSQYNTLIQEVDGTVEVAWAKADSDPYPEENATREMVYASVAND